MIQYLNILNDLLYGSEVLEKPTRTGIKTNSISGVQFKHDMRTGFPLLTTKRMGIKSIATELEFFIKGLRDKTWLQERGCTIWDEWANPKAVNSKLSLKLYENPNDMELDRLKIQKEESDLGRIYGVQWRDWRYFEWCDVQEMAGINKAYIPNRFDQLKDVIERAKKNPLDRRLLVTAWRPDELDEMALPPCHYAWQILSDGFYLDLIWVQRSIDTFLGLPYNIASYGILLTLLGLELNLKPRFLIGQLADTHLYHNHFEQAREQLSRDPYQLPELRIKDFTNIFKWKYTDIELVNYKHHPKITAPIAV